MNNKANKELALRAILNRNLNANAANRVMQLVLNLTRNHPTHNKNLVREARRRLNNYNVFNRMNNNSNSNSNSNNNNNWAPFNWQSAGTVVSYPANRIGKNGVEPFTQNSYRNNTRYVQVRSNGKKYYFNRNQFYNWTLNPAHNYNPLTRTPLSVENLKMVRFANVPTMNNN